MNIAILHQDLEYQEELIKQAFEAQHFNVKLFDVRDLNPADVAAHDLILNRVFASVANRNYEDNLKTLWILEDLEKQGKQIINSYFTSSCDYSKSFSSRILIENEIPTPETHFINDKQHIDKALAFAQEKGYPIILKRDMGGRAKDIYLATSPQELTKRIIDRLNDKSDNYAAGYVVQEFIPSVIPHDYRISVINGNVVAVNGRTLMDTPEAKSWLASASRGSIVVDVEAPQEVIDLALASTQAIKATFNEVDIIMGREGPIIIENNPTPNFTNNQTSQRKLHLTIQTLIKLLKTREEAGKISVEAE